MKADIKDLNLTGSMELKNMPKRECRWGAVAGVLGAQGTDVECKMTISNVKCSINMTATAPVAGNSVRMSGFTGIIAGGNIPAEINIKDCVYSGTLTTTENVRECTGFVGTSGGGTPGSIVTLTNCEFAGKIDFNQTAVHGTLRISGIVGSAERTTTLYKCKSSGEINANAGGDALVSDTGGLAGMCGRTNAQSGELNMTYSILECVNTSAIKVTNLKSGADISHIQQIIGTAKSNANLTLDGNTEGGSVNISYAN
jgi:hypothetical protein